MNRQRIPPCAVCGCPTSARTGRVIMQWDGVKGRPKIACHLDCQDKLPWKHGDPLEPLLRWVSLRGEDRIWVSKRVGLRMAMMDAASMDETEATS